MARRPRVGRVVLAPTIARKAEADSIADRLSVFAGDRLPKLIEEALQGYGDDERERLLDSLTLDIGTIEPDKLEARLEERLVGLLRSALMDRFGLPLSDGRHGARAGEARKEGAFTMQPAAASTDGVAPRATAFGATEQMAVEPTSVAGRTAAALGDVHLMTLAAWFEGRVDLAADAIEQAFVAALEANTVDVVRLMREQGRHTARRERWVGAMTPNMRLRAVHALRPNDARQVLGDVTYMAARQRAAPVAAMRADAFDDALWQTVFAYLLADRGGRFNRRSFLSTMLTGLAARAGLGYVALIDALLERVGIASQQIDRDESLRDVLVALRADADGQRHDRAQREVDGVRPARPRAEGDGPATPRVDLDARDAEALEFYLDYGASPWFADDDFDPAGAALRLATQSPLRMVMLLRGGAVRARRDRAERRIERLAASFDARARAEWIMQVEPVAGRRIVAALAALERLVERMPWSASKRASLRRAMSMATLEETVWARAGAFADSDWFERMVARGAEAARVSPREVVDALLLATYEEDARRRRAKIVRAGLVGLALIDARADGSTKESTVEAGSERDPIDIETLASPLLRAFILAWPGLLQRVGRTPTSFDAAMREALFDAPTRSSARSAMSLLPPTSGVPIGAASHAENALLFVLTRLARYHGIPMRRWIAALSRDAAWRTADPGLATVRRWRREISHGEHDDEPVGRIESRGAAHTLIEFICTGSISGEALAPWFAMPVEQWLDAALREDGAGVIARLRAHSADPAVLRRLSAYLPPAGRARLVAALDPSIAPISSDILRAASTMASAIGRPNLEREAHRAVIAALLAPSGARASLQSIVSRVVDALARRTGIDAVRLAQGLLAGVSPAHAALREALAAKIADCERTSPGVAATDSTSHERVDARGPRALRQRAHPSLAIVAAFLRYGERGSDAGLLAAFTDLADRAPHGLKRLIERAASGEPGATRLASLDALTFAVIARTWQPRQAHAAAALAAAAAAFERSAAEPMRLRAQRSWLRHAMSGRKKTMFSSLVEATLGDWDRIDEIRGDEPAPSGARPAGRFVLARWRHAVRSTASDAALEREWLEWLAARESIAEARERRSIAPSRAAGEHAEQQTEPKPEAASDIRRPPDPPRARPAHTPHSHEAPMSSEAPTEPVRVDNAGVVMLWPFLSRFFELLDLTQAGRFVDFDAQSRAVHLLHALATNEIARHEALLPLAKIMCGLAPAISLAAGADRARDEREIEISEGLLNGVKQNWDKLRGTTLDGLRESFLMRVGRLLHEGNGESHWRLDVERKAYDVLLDTLPWSLSIVRLGWMTEHLVVNWNRRQ